MKLIVMATTASGIVWLGGAALAGEGIHVSYADLNLARPGDAIVFQARVETAAERLCRSRVPSQLDEAALKRCGRIVWDEVKQQLPADTRLAFEKSVGAGSEIALARQ